jgi:hypothetical protein
MVWRTNEGCEMRKLTVEEEFATAASLEAAARAMGWRRPVSRWEPYFAQAAGTDTVGCCGSSRSKKWDGFRFGKY